MTGIHGDPINVGLIGTKDELVAAMLAAKWQPADPITFKSSAKLVRSVVLHRPDETAPVYNLYLWKRKEDLAFEQEVGKTASRRHHVRFWESAKQVGGRLLWLGAATFNTKIGFSHTTGMPTHHIDANIDAEREKLMNDLIAAGRLSSTEGVEGFQPKHDGRNGAAIRTARMESCCWGFSRVQETKADRYGTAQVPQAGSVQAGGSARYSTTHNPPERTGYSLSVCRGLGRRKIKRPLHGFPLRNRRCQE